MRLICPNCGAQYEVADDVIPDAGRDVQCSNCGNTWFERPGDSAKIEEQISGPAEDVDARQDMAPEPEPAPEPAPEPEPEPEVAASDDSSADDMGPGTAESEEPPTEAAPASAPERTNETLAAMLRDEGVDVSDTVADSLTETADDVTEAVSEAAADVPPSRRPELDASVAAILQEEAERERSARAGESTDAFESQSDLPLDAAVDETAAQREAEARARVARIKGEEEAQTSAAIASTVAASRKELLPDIDEINSTLRPDADRAMGEMLTPEAEEVIQRRGFRLGFLGVLFLMAGLWIVYAFSKELSSAIPAAEPTIAGYTDRVDSARLWVDLRIQSLVAGLEDSGEN